MHFPLELPVPPVSVKEVVFDSAVSDIQVRQGPGWWFLWGWWHMIFAPWIGFKSLRTSCAFFWFRDVSNPHLFSFELVWNCWVLVHKPGFLKFPEQPFDSKKSRHKHPASRWKSLRFPVAGRRSKDGHHPDHQGVQILAAYQPWSAVVVKTALPKILKDLRRWHWNM